MQWSVVISGQAGCGHRGEFSYPAPLLPLFIECAWGTPPSIHGVADGASGTMMQTRPACRFFIVGRKPTDTAQADTTP